MSTQYIFDSSGFLIGISEGIAPQENSTTIPPIYREGFTPRFINGEWIDQSTPPKVGPITFKMLFTGEERVKAKELRATNPALDDFWSLLDDPRTTEVDMGLASVQGAIEYTLTVVKAAGVTVDVPSRKAAILTGQVQ